MRSTYNVAVALGLAVLGGFALASPRQPPPPFAVVVAELNRTNAGQRIEAAPKLAVGVMTYDLPPNGATVLHWHPHQRLIYVLAGTLTVINAETGEKMEYSAGKFFAEMRNIRHTEHNFGTRTTRFLAISLMPEGGNKINVRRDGDGVAPR
jgi:quercetin dioxygenase-like cupin family protein